MKQLKLFDVPKDSPSHRERLKAFIAAQGIETHYCHGIEAPWMACHMPSARDVGKGYGKTISNIGDAVADLCRLLDERGILVTGYTERSTVRELCENLKLPLPPEV